jgi:transposase
MDGFTGFKTAAAEELPDAVAVMDPFHVVRLAGDALDRAGAGSNKTSTATAADAQRPAVPARRTLHTGEDLLTDRQRERLALFANDDHVEVEATWGIYQRMIAAYRDPDPASGKTAHAAVIDAIRDGVPAALVELITLGRTLNQRAADVLAYFDRPGTSNGPTEALNGRLEHLRGSALGFRNLTNYIARASSRPAASDPRPSPPSRTNSRCVVGLVCPTTTDATGDPWSQQRTGRCIGSPCIRQSSAPRWRSS